MRAPVQVQLLDQLQEISVNAGARRFFSVGILSANCCITVCVNQRSSLRGNPLKFPNNYMYLPGIRMQNLGADNHTRLQFLHDKHESAIRLR